MIKSLLLFIGLTLFMSFDLLAKDTTSLLKLAPVQKQAESDLIIYKKRTLVDFESLQINGSKKEPNHSFIFAKKNHAFSSMLQLKRKFSHKIKQSVINVQTNRK